MKIVAVTLLAAISMALAGCRSGPDSGPAPQYSQSPAPVMGNEPGRIAP